jgi:hypothetical protein
VVAIDNIWRPTAIVPPQTAHHHEMLVDTSWEMHGFSLAAESVIDE